MRDWRQAVQARLAPLGLEPHQAVDVTEELALELEERHARAVREGHTEEEADALVRGELLSESFSAEIRTALQSPPPRPAPDAGLGQAAGLLGGLREDVRYAARLLVKSPVFTLAAVASLALGVGANTTVFSLVNQVLLNPLPVQEPSRLVALYTTDAKNRGRFQEFMTTSFPNFRDYREQGAAVFSGVAASVFTPLSLTSGGDPEQVPGELVTGNYFDVLGVPAAAGRTFSFTASEDEQTGAHPVVVMSDGLWKRRFGASGAVVGSVIEVNRQRFTVLGVAPPGFRGVNALGGPALWLPVSARKQVLTGFTADNFDDRRALLFNTVARLKPGVTARQAESALTTIAAGLEAAHPRENDSRGATLAPLTGFDPEFRRDVSLASAVLMGVVALVLLIACANVANLLLARAAGRRREIAIRISLGASRGRLIRQLLTESALLGLLAGAAGLLVARLSRDLLWSMRPPFLTADALDLGFSRTVLGFTLLLSLLTALVFGLVPALQLSRPQLVDHLKDRTNRPSGFGRLFAFRNVLVMAQVALSLVTLVGAGLFLRSLRNAQRTDPGFETSSLLVLSFNAGAEGYTGESAAAFQRTALERVRALPGIEAAVVASSGLFAGGFSRTVFPEGVDPNDRRNGRLTPLNQVGPGYFDTLGIPIRHGRPLAESDGPGSPMVAVVNETMARRLWPDQEPLGKRFRCFGEDWTIEVVGVARDAKYFTIGEEPQPFFYLPLAQHPSAGVTLHVRTAGDPAAALGAVRAQVQSLDARMPITNVQTIRELFDQVLWAPRMSASLLGAFALLALLLAAVGVHGVVSYSVSERTQEFGIRMAMGARPVDMLGMVIGQTLLTASVGAAVALVVAYALTRGLGNLLIGVPAGDPVTFGGTLAVILGAALAASAWPAWRASRTDPLVALRYD
ncbi:MAG TPA: ABC transporter permease [Vicinamibacteria bacterium]|nr:ABC transporter permease [Vicinamibacteria bacterium]